MIATLSGRYMGTIVAAVRNGYGLLLWRVRWWDGRIVHLSQLSVNLEGWRFQCPD